jgi:hypothetical protein
MEADRGKAISRGWCSVMLSTGCLIVFSTSIVGQRSGDPARARIQEMSKKEMQLSVPAAASKGLNDPRRAKEIMDQVGQDFDRILTLHNEIVRAIAANRSLSDQFISDATGEIRKRSLRLQATLKLPKPEAGQENRQSTQNLKTMATKDELILLCKEIESFVKNPIIETPGTVDAKQLDRARRNLEHVVQLSESLKKRADKQKT